MLTTLGIIAVVWGLLTLWVEKQGPARTWDFGRSGERTALLVYDPDPIYNLDEQVCKAFAQSLSEKGWYAGVKTVSAAAGVSTANYDLVVFCANTYNWAPDWAITRFIRRNDGLQGRNVVAITLGSGSTHQSKRKMEALLRAQHARLVDSRTFWLMRPNDESRSGEKNVAVALSMVHQWAEGISDALVTSQ